MEKQLPISRYCSCLFKRWIGVGIALDGLGSICRDSAQAAQADRPRDLLPLLTDPNIGYSLVLCTLHEDILHSMLKHTNGKGPYIVGPRIHVPKLFIVHRARVGRHRSLFLLVLLATAVWYNLTLSTAVRNIDPIHIMQLLRY